MHGGAHDQPLSPTGRRDGRPRLSVVLLSTGEEGALERAVLSVREAVSSVGAQLVIVREEGSPGARERVQRLALQHRCVLTFVQPGSSRAGMSREGMCLASGDIVVIRQDVAVRDAEWLAAIEGVCGRPMERGASAADVSTDLEVADDRAVVGGRQSGRPAHSTRRRGDASSEPLT